IERYAALLQLRERVDQRVDLADVLVLQRVPACGVTDHAIALGRCLRVANHGEQAGDDQDDDRGQRGQDRCGVDSHPYRSSKEVIIAASSWSANARRLPENVDRKPGLRGWPSVQRKGGPAWRRC